MTVGVEEGGFFWDGGGFRGPCLRVKKEKVPMGLESAFDGEVCGVRRRGESF